MIIICEEERNHTVHLVHALEMWDNWMDPILHVKWMYKDVTRVYGQDTDVSWDYSYQTSTSL